MAIKMNDLDSIYEYAKLFYKGHEYSVDKREAARI